MRFLGVKGFFLFISLVSTLSFAGTGDFLERVHELTLANGMKFLLLKREGPPVFSAYIRVKVGGIDEADGKTGIAHLLEHMAFKGNSEVGTKDYDSEKIILKQIEEVHEKKLNAKGSRRKALDNKMKDLLKEAGRYVVKEEFSKIYQRNGATGLNATTSQDLTSYFVTLPSNKLRLWAYMESQRLKDPVFREFYSERDVVGEERRMRVEDSPFGSLYEAFINLSFEKSPYRRPTIGYQVDIEKLSATDLKNFYEKYYVPKNMVVALVGNFDLEEVKGVVKEYFGPILDEELPPNPQVAEPEPQRPKRVVIRFDASPSLMFGYLKPNMPQDEDYVFDVLEQILCEGRTSRLYKDLVVKKRLVQSISCNPSTPGSRLYNLFFVYASIRKGHTPDEVLQAFDKVVASLESEGVSEKELKKAKKNILSQWFFSLQSNREIAEALSYFEAIAGTWKYILNHQEKIKSITEKDIQKVVVRYLQPQRRRVAILKPLKGG